MTRINIREMRSSETLLLKSWLFQHRETNLVDMEPFVKGQVRVFVAEQDDEIVAFIPVRAVFWYDALAPNPDADPQQLASAFSAMHDYLINEAKEKNVSKVYVQPNDAKFSEFIQQHFDFSPVSHQTLEFNFNKVAEPAKCV
jgi:hypothetical protein